MYLCETVLMGCIFALGICAISTDIQKGIIPNKLLCIAFCIGLVNDILYYGIYGRQYFKAFFANIVLVIVFSILMYFFHFWAAGDSKLLICIFVLYPARFYHYDSSFGFPMLEVIIYIFLVAYLYIIADTIFNMIKNKKTFRQKLSIGKQVIPFLINYVIVFLYLRALGAAFETILGDIYIQYQLLFSFFNIFVALMIYRCNYVKKWYSLLVIVIINVLVFMLRPCVFESLDNYIILFFALILRYWANGYNYQEIETTKVEKGMVLSFFTVERFKLSKVKGLPQDTREDMSTRITEDQAMAIKRWEKSKMGTPTIIIVRKIPFAIFIVAGVVVYFIKGIID